MEKTAKDIFSEINEAVSGLQNQLDSLRAWVSGLEAELEAAQQAAKAAEEALAEQKAAEAAAAETEAEAAAVETVEVVEAVTEEPEAPVEIETPVEIEAPAEPESPIDISFEDIPEDIPVDIVDVPVDIPADIPADLPDDLPAEEPAPEPVDITEPEPEPAPEPVFALEAEPEPAPKPAPKARKAVSHAWRTDIAGAPVSNIISGISLNDRVLFINTLFKEDPMLFQGTISAFNVMGSLDEAVEYVEEKFPEWNLGSEVVYRLMMAVRRKLK